MTREEAIKWFEKRIEAERLLQEEVRKYGRLDDTGACEQDIEACNMAIEALEQESLTDGEKRIFLSAMHREEKVCEKLDEEYKGYTKGTPLVPMCREIVRKVRAALWDEQK